MRDISELGISPWPWHTSEDNWIDSLDGNPVLSNAAYACNQHDANLISAAPDEYNEIYNDCLCLKKIVEKIDEGAEVLNLREVLWTMYRQMESVLAKAAGESEVAHD